VKIGVGAYGWNQGNIEGNIIRYSLSPTDSGEGIVGQQCANLTISGNEMHDHSWAIHELVGHDNIMNNLIYGGAPIDRGISNAIHSYGSESGPGANIRGNTLVGTIWGIEIGASSPRIEKNIIALNSVGVYYYLLDGPQSPHVDVNDVTLNKSLNYRQEVNVYHTDPLKADSDGDGVNDATEIQWGFDPLDPDSTPHLPVAGLIGLGVLASAFALAGARRARRT